MKRARQLGVEAGGSPTIRALGGGLLTFALGSIADLSGPVAFIVGFAVILSLLAILATSVRIERRIRSAEGTSRLAARLGPHLPPVGGWSIEGDFATLIERELQQGRTNVVECGAGVTTLVIATHLEARKTGRLLTLEHEPRFAAQTQERLRAAGLQNRVDIVVAPLKSQAFGKTRTDWYEIDALNTALPDCIDLLIVDGPPSRTGWSRWPAMEVFGDRLAPGAVVLLDDGRRRLERRIAWHWERHHRDLKLYWVDTLKGTWRLEKLAGPRVEGRAEATLRSLIRRLNPRPKSFGDLPMRR